jgi:hypothetical protein
MAEAMKEVNPLVRLLREQTDLHIKQYRHILQ